MAVDALSSNQLKRQLTQDVGRKEKIRTEERPRPPRRTEGEVPSEEDAVVRRSERRETPGAEVSAYRRDLKSNEKPKKKDTQADAPPLPLPEPPPPPPPTPVAEASDGNAGAAQTPSSNADTTAAQRTSTVKRPRERIQIQIAREAGLLKEETSTPKKEASPAETTESTSRNGGRIQEQLLINGAGFTTGSRQPLETSSKEETERKELDESVKKTTGSSGSTSYQSPTQQLEQYFAQQALKTLGSE